MIKYGNIKDPFIIGLFQGVSKPKIIAEYLKDFIVESKHLIQSGLFLMDKHFDIVLSSIICDAPAHAYLNRLNVIMVILHVKDVSRKGFL